jgi:hypothetical protein
MDIKKIKEIVNSDFPEDFKKYAILSTIAKDRDAIPYMLQVLEEEREQQRELLLDTNLELSRALVVLNDKNLKSNKKVVTDPKWVVGEIKKHYVKWKNHIKCNFNIEGL